MGKYEEALERARQGKPIDEVFPELKESEDERIRKALIHIVKGACSKYGIKYRNEDIGEEKLLAYLEKQKPAEWSEDDEKMIDDIIRVLTKMAESEDNILPEILPSVARKYVERLKALRPSWKPSEEQMVKLHNIIERAKKGCCYNTVAFLESLYNDLEKLI